MEQTQPILGYQQTHKIGHCWHFTIPKRTSIALSHTKGLAVAFRSHQIFSLDNAFNLKEAKQGPRHFLEVPTAHKNVQLKAWRAWPAALENRLPVMPRHLSSRELVFLSRKTGINWRTFYPKTAGNLKMAIILRERNCLSRLNVQECVGRSLTILTEPHG